MLATTTPQMEFDETDSPRGITREWIQSLPAELKDEALLRLLLTIEAKPTLVEVFALNQVLYRTISGGTFTESADNVAARTGCDRKTILKGLEQAYNQNILDRNVRPGTSTEYFFKPESEWKPEPERVVRKTDIRTKPPTEFPTTLEQTQDFTTIQFDTVETEPVLNTDYPETDSNGAGVLKELEELSTEVSAGVEDAPKSSPWKYVGQGLPRIYIAPELDQETGSKIESMHEATSRPRQFILKEAVDLLYNQVNRIPNTDDTKPAGFTHASSVAIPIAVITTPTPPASKIFDASVELEDIDIDELGDVMTQIKLQLRIPIGTGMKDSIKRNWKGDTHFNNALASCVETAEWFERQNKLEKEKLFGMLINAMKLDKKPRAAASSPEKLQNASAYSNTPASVLQSYSELIKSALTKPDGDFLRDARIEIISTCFSTGEFFGFEFIDRCKALVNEQARNQLMISIREMIKRFGDKWGVVINDEGQVVAV